VARPIVNSPWRNASVVDEPGKGSIQRGTAARRLRRGCAYAWALPTTSVGLCFVPLAMLGGGMQWVDGVLELYGGPVGFFLRRCTLLKGGASAMTLGHVVLGRDRDALAWTRAHERVHVRQCERWGPLFLPAYLAGSMIAVLRGRRAYRDNPFEREAYEREGG
jgi:hypothetical protein